MTAKETKPDPQSWMIDGYGNVAYAGGDDRENLLLRGWKTEKEQPAAGQAWVFHEATGNHAQMPVTVLPEFAALGWLPSTAPAEPDLTKDPRYIDQPAPADAPKEK